MRDNEAMMFMGRPLMVRAERMSVGDPRTVTYRFYVDYQGETCAVEKMFYPREIEENFQQCMRMVTGELFAKIADTAAEQLCHVKETIGEIDHTQLMIRMRDRNNIHFTTSPEPRTLREVAEHENNGIGIASRLQQEHEMRRDMELMERNHRRAVELAATSVLRFPGSMRPGSENYFDEYPPSSPRKQDKIQSKAWQLLEEKIGKKKFNQLNKQGYFTEKGKHGTYHFYKNDMSGVRFIQNVNVGGKKRPLKWTLCIQSAVADMPKGDVILSRWMELKADEDQFQKTANWRDVSTKDEAM